MLEIFSKFSHTIFKKIFGGYFNESGFITYVNNIQWFTIAKFFSLALSLLTTVVIARILGPEIFGTLNYIISIVGIFSVIANLGLGSIIYKELVLRKENREEILGSAIFLNIVAGLVAMATVFVSLLYIQESREIEILIILMSLSFLTQPLTHLSFDFLKDSDGKYVTITQIITSFISSVFKIVLMYYFASIAYFIIVLILENIIAGALYIYQIVNIKKRSIRLKIKKEEVFLLFSFGLPLALFSVFSEIYARIDQIMLKHYLDIKAVGLYAAGVRLTEIWYMVPNIILGALFPALANAKHDVQEYKKRFNSLLIVLSLLAVTISITVFFTRDFLIRVVYGTEFLATSPLLGVYIFSIIGFFISLLISQDLILKNKKWALLFIPLSTALLNVVLNMYLIPLKGALGAALATVISYNIIPLLFVMVMKFKVHKL
ncbi:MAG: hypothetical protein QG653_178 [Patescibacteria group bacterium]|nr:hypothetical protein [Patescibacteria group bacterium]